MKKTNLLGIKSCVLAMSMFGLSANAAVTLESSTKIADNALFFDGYQLGNSNLNGYSTQDHKDDVKYNYKFGGSISAHGDSVKVYKNYVFMSWYRGGKLDRHVMLSRLNTETGVVKTIEFPHRHTGYQGNWWIGESHNTIGIAVSPKNGTIHMVYDMHAYSQTSHSGKFADDYFRYSYSVAGAAEVPDEEFTLDKFVKDTSSISQGSDDYKHLTMTGSLSAEHKANFSALTYPKFYETKDGDLLHYMRWGGNNNGAYYYNSYDADAQKWSLFKQFNRKDQKNCSGDGYNWGLYGYMKYVNGKLRVGFQRRSSNNSDKYQYQNGIYYAYLDDPANNVWRDHTGKRITWPLCNADEIKIFEPGDLVETTAANKVYIVGGFDWTVTEKGDIHVIHLVKDKEINKSVYGHLYKPAGATEFIHAPGIPGASKIYTAGEDIYIIGLKNKKPYVQVAKGGTTEFTTIYEDTSTPINFQHGVAYIKDGKVYYYLMQEMSGNARPIHLQVIDLGLDPDKPVVSFNKTLAPQFEGYGQISLGVNAVSPADSGRFIEKVDLFINDNLVRSDDSVPYLWGHNSKPTELTGLPVGVHTIKAVATDSEGATGVAAMQFEVKSTAPEITFPVTKTVEEGYEQLGVSATVVSPIADRTIESVTLFINGEEVRKDTTSPYNWGHKFKPHETGAMGWISCDQDPVPNPCHQPNPSPLPAGEHTFTVVAVDSAGKTSSADMILEVQSLAPTVSFPWAAKTVQEGYDKFTIAATAEPAKADRFIESVTLYINDEYIRTDTSDPYLWGHGSKPHETGAMGWEDKHGVNPNPFTAGEYIFKAVAVDNKGATSEATMVLTVEAAPKPPVVSFPWETKTVVEGYEKLYIDINAESPNEGGSIESVSLYIDDELVRVDTKAKFDFGHGGAPHETGAMGWLDTHQPNPNPLTAGEHTFTAVAKDSQGLESTATMTLIVKELPGPTVEFSESEIDLIEGYEELSLSVIAEGAASYVDVTSVALYANDELIREIYQGPYTWGGVGYEGELLALPVGLNILKAVATDSKGKQSEALLEFEVKELVLPEASFEQAKIIKSVGYDELALTVDAINTASYISITQVDLYVDGELVGTDYDAPYEFGDDYELLGLALGVHTVKAVATDTQGNQAEAEMLIDVKPAIVSVGSESSDTPVINLFDGDYSDESSWGAETNGTKELVVDLGEVKTIVSTKLWTVGAELVKYHIFVADTENGEFVKAGSHMPKKNSSHPFTADFVAQGRYVKLMVLGDWPNINEFEVTTE